MCLAIAYEPCNPPLGPVSAQKVPMDVKGDVIAPSAQLSVGMLCAWPRPCTQEFRSHFVTAPALSFRDCHFVAQAGLSLPKGQHPRLGSSG
ncbi:Tbc1 Domain Family Member 12 [Manis pentadactyla]|nr:Tbc1 Domain Family Member 12 [Manis pentadactyla]